MKNNALSFLGLLNKAGKTVFGEALFSQGKKIACIVLAFDASDTSKKRLLSFGKEKMILEGVSKEELGHYLGYEEISAVGILDKKAALALKKKWEE